MAEKQLAIVLGLRIANKSAKGRPSYAKMKGLLVYIAYGGYVAHSAQRKELRGQWLDHNGKPRSHEDTLCWAKEKVHRYGHEYTYSLLLSTRYGGLRTDDFKRVLQQGSDLSDVHEWRLMVHEDSENQHAHVILLRQEKLSKDRYKQWQQTMQAELGHLQAERQAALAQQADLTRQVELETEPSAERALEQTQSQGWDLAYD